ncbi:unnamed protein product [Didymodactylos carnosus]|uniref:G-protein coupled receptors family 1 profile domain-containing protein n=1 Tax=Didymodactylos carnosus TaxID=1234261 RepID=A0A815XZT2_9BILA|nr:unnamed protein product [Didymodactylos carnosus]CAF1563858.1 unnamed protein product [Didymodactylos carnosus]CAF4255662.1 unnamed protein product [Didymodactylos carnosus]CAF4425688.1 unnamed protein product [Didymodactylos carnosus]
MANATVSSSSSSDAALISTLNYLSFQLNQYLSIFILIFGTVGNLLNIFIFLQPSLRTNPCSIYLLSSSFGAVGAYSAGLLTKLLSIYNWDLTAYSNPLCKIKTYILFISFTLSTWFIALASGDRYLISCSNMARRRLSNLKNTYRCIQITIIVTLLLFVELFYCYEGQQFTGSPQPCYSKTQTCRLYNDLVFVTLFVILPSIIMFFFGYLTILNIQRLRRSIAPTSTTTSTASSQAKGLKRSDRQLIRMLVVQILLQTIFILPFAVQRLYNTSTTNVTNKTLVRVAVENLLFQLVQILRYVSYGVSFYCYTLTGTVFRYELLKLLYRLKIIKQLPVPSQTTNTLVTKNYRSTVLHLTDGK